jgi:cation:H+ antiporter
MSPAIDIALGVLGLVFVWFGSTGLEKSSERLAVYYGLPDVVTGAVVVAVGSSFPELTTAVMAPLLHGSFELGVSAIVGSALFNILVLPGAAGLARPGDMPANRDLVYKESLFYLLSVSVLLLTFALAVIYVPGEARLTGVMTRGLALVPLVLYGLYVFVQILDTIDVDLDVDRGDIVVWKQWLLLGGSLLAILLGVEGLIRGVLAAGDLLGVPDFVWGVTVVAAGTSLPDLLVSVQAARNDHPVTAVANALGSNTFDLLVCIPAGVLIAGSATVDFTLAAPLMAALTVATLVLFFLLRTGLRLQRWESITLISLYVAFLAWMILESVDVIDLLPG